MYEAYFHLQKRPFSATPDATCCFAPEPIQEALDELILRTESGQGIGVLTAPAGTGKTLACRRIAAELAGTCTPVFLANANLPTRRALLQSILFELGRRYSRMEEQELRLSVYRALKDLVLTGRGAVVIVDEAHLLSDRLLEELRMLASLSEQDEPLARLILAGQLSLEERLADPALEALNQRVVCHRYLEPLTRLQSIDYVLYRIGWAGGGNSEIFTPDALERVAFAAGGIPRCINHLCDHALLLAYVHEQRQVSAELVDEALLDLKQLPLQWNVPLVELDAAQSLREPAIAEIGHADNNTWPDAEEAVINKESGEPAAIEIGGGSSFEEDDDSDVVESSHSVTAEEPWSGAADRDAQDLKHSGSGVVPLSEPVPQALRGFVEEFVDDRYAALDAGMPRILRTFNDAVVPEKLRLARNESIPAAPQLPTEPLVHVDAPASEPLVQTPEPTMDEMVSLVDQGAGSESSDSQERAAGPESTHESDGARHVRVRQRELEDLEEQIGSSILDTCLEVQTAIGRWDDAQSAAGGEVSTSGASSGGQVTDSGEYDIIEPEHRAASARAYVSGITPHSGERAPERYVPAPKYRHVFSTLRRRLGLKRG